MFVYQDKDRNICVTFRSNKPVEQPEYVIAIDEAAKALYMVSGMISQIPDESGETTSPGGFYTQAQLDAAIEKAVRDAFASIENAEEGEY